MMLADMGADVIRIDRASSVPDEQPDGPRWNILNRNRRSIGIDLKTPGGVETLLSLVDGAEALLEGFRPGVMERLGVGPDVCLERNPKLVYARMTGWGQEGPYAHAAGHDINYIALSGALAHIGPKGGQPVPPLNLVGDFGGGGMFLAYGIVCGLLEARSSGEGQVVDCAMVDGSAALMAPFYGQMAAGRFNEERGTNMLDTGSHFYNTYECADGEYISIGSIEPQFYAELLEKTELTDDADFARQMEQEGWPALRERLVTVFKTKSRAEWCEIMEMTDICFAPVLAMSDVLEHPHNKARSSFPAPDGVAQPAPAPRFSRTSPEISRPPALAGEHTDEVLKEWAGMSEAKVAELREQGAIR